LKDHKDNALSVNIIPIRGKFRMAVRNDGLEPDESQKYWNTDDNHLLIKSDDPQFKNHGDYKIAVWANVSEEELKEYKEKGAALNFQFRIRYSHLGKHVVLAPGHQEVGTLEKDSHCFVALLNADAKDVMVFKSMNNLNLSMHVSLDDEFQRPDMHTATKSADFHTVGVIFNKEEITKHCGKFFRNAQPCHMYVCLSGPENSLYSITYSYNSLPWLLRESETFYGPIVTRDGVAVN